MLGALLSRQDQECRIVGDKNDADVLVVNTCAFIESAKEESIDAILDAVRLKAEGKVQRVIVTGCLAQRYGADLVKELPEVDAFLGIEGAPTIGNVVFGDAPSREPKLASLDEKYPLIPRARARAGAPWSAYLKVSEGCDHGCAFCSIPSFRGRHRSKPIERLVNEASQLAQGGVRELCLIAQDTTAYGLDLYRRLALPELLSAVSAVDGIEWIRLLYCYPTMVGEPLIQAIASNPKVLPYVDMPLQHSDDRLLAAMKRGGSRAQYVKLFQRMREAIPDLALRTTFIVGFPGETDEQFADLMRFIDEVRFDRVGVFLYSKEEGTPAASLPGDVSRRTAARRRDALMTAQRSLSLSANKAWIGREMDVLIEYLRGADAVGRSFRDAPEIDGAVVVRGASCEPGSIARVRITGADYYDLKADLIAAESGRALATARS